MSAPVFVLHVPVDPDYRSIAHEVVAKYVDLIGGTESERVGLEAVLSRTVDDLAQGGMADDDIELACVSQGAGFEVTVRCRGRSAVVRHPAPTGR